MVCTTCGANGPLECHHIGRRRYSNVTTMLCVPCHVYCTIADVYERQWRPGEPGIAHMWAGLMDIWDRFCMCNRFKVSAIDVLLDAEYQGIFRYRPCAQVADYVEQISDDTLPEQLSEMWRLIKGITGYES